jgi:hypothetical protein
MANGFDFRDRRCIEIAVKRLASWGTVDQLNRPNLDHAMPVQRLEPGYLGIDDDFTHGQRIQYSINNIARWRCMRRSSTV